MEKIVGWKEVVSLPALGIASLKCKVDTGAKNSAIHAFEVKEFTQDGQRWVRFKVHTDDNNSEVFHECEAKVQDVRKVTNSGGYATNRFFIETEIQLGDYTIRAPMSLTSRDTMAFKMLLGRTALRKAGLLVDPSKEFLQGGHHENSDSV